MRVDDDPAWLNRQAQRCLTLAASTLDERTATILKDMARDYQARAAEIERATAAINDRPEPQAGNGQPSGQ